MSHLGKLADHRTCQDGKDGKPICQDGKLLLEVRQRLNLTQSQLAEMLELGDSSQVSRVEAGRRPLSRRLWEKVQPLLDGGARPDAPENQGLSPRDYIWREAPFPPGLSYMAMSPLGLCRLESDEPAVGFESEAYYVWHWPYHYLNPPTAWKDWPGNRHVHWDCAWRDYLAAWWELAFEFQPEENALGTLLRELERLVENPTSEAVATLEHTLRHCISDSARRTELFREVFLECQHMDRPSPVQVRELVRLQLENHFESTRFNNLWYLRARCARALALQQLRSRREATTEVLLGLAVQGDVAAGDCRHVPYPSV